MSRAIEDVSVVNKQKLAIAAVLKTVRESTPLPAPGTLLQLGESGEVTTNRGATVRKKTETAK